MISRSTVLVLGAGASKDYGFPTGVELMNKIQRECEDQNGPSRSCICSSGSNDKDVKKLLLALKETQLNSIDSLLEHREDLRQVGKLAIAAALIPCEEGFRLNPTGDHWYRKLFNTLVAGGAFDGSKLTVLTLNYDRSLEEYLFQTVKREFRLETDEAARRVQKINFIHFHGQLGRLPWWHAGEDAPAPHHYAPDLTCERLEAAASGIRVVSEFEQHSDSRHLLMQVNSELKSAEVVGFLGFGYHRSVLERFGLAEISGQNESLQIFGSACGVPRGRRDELRSSFLGVQLGDPHHTVTQFIDECTLFFQSGSAGGPGSRKWANLQARRGNHPLG